MTETRTATITCHGGAGSVTGANFLFDIGTQKILVDCGVHQRENTCDPLNHAAFPYDTSAIDTLLVTHAHADHIGRIPKLVREGFRGVIYSTAATMELAALMFDDSLAVMQQEALRSGCPALYDKGDVDHALSLWKSHEYHQPFTLGDAQVEFLDAGHILGSAMMKFTRGGKTMLFTGDLGNSPEPLLHDTESPEGADYILMESVYGDRVHESRDTRGEQLCAAIETARQRGGTLMIPSFSIERTQILLYEMDSMIEAGKMKPMPVYLDAPLATRVTEVYRRHPDMLNEAAQQHFAHDDPFKFKGLSVVHHTAESHALHGMPDPKIIIAGAGMSVGGRIRAHEVRYLPDPKATLLFVGYQAPGSLGRRIQEGARSVNIDGKHVAVNCAIATLTGYSGHRDRDGLLDFVSHAQQSVKKVFVCMGEPKASQFLAQRIRDFLDVNAVVPNAGEVLSIDF
jgi:metallo-beta-lactamase family protein